jgi:hypothetical protein
MKYRVICSLCTDRWNRNPANRYGKAEAAKAKAVSDIECQGEHTIEPIYE